MPAKPIHQLYVTAHFDYITPWVGEQAQCGWRMGMVPVGAVPGPGSTFTPQIANFDSFIGATGSNATWNWSQPWRAEWGGDSWTDVQSLAVAEAVKTYFTSVAADISNLVRFKGVKIALINDDGSYAHPSAEFNMLVQPGGGVTGTSQVPPEVSVVTTLRAPVLGRRGRGRWYLPSPGVSTAQADNGTVLAAFRTRLANAGKTLVDNFYAVGSANVDFRPLVGIASSTSATMIRPSQVRVGNHYDVQRRRQHQVTETYTSVSL